MRLRRTRFRWSEFMDRWGEYVPGARGGQWHLVRWWTELPADFKADHRSIDGLDLIGWFEDC